MDGYFLGGSLLPIGINVNFLAAERDVVLDELIRWRTGLGHGLVVGRPEPTPACVRALDPLEAPWTVELTTLEIIGPDGVPPPMSLRRVSAYAEDGRWHWEELGTVQPFELPDRYTARLKRDRFDRPLLVQYLHALGIEVDDPTFYGEGIAVRQKVRWARRRESAAEVRRDWGWPSSPPSLSSRPGP